MHTSFPRRTWRTSVATACLAAALVIAGAATPATAADAQWWYSAYNADQAHADGLTGKGVKVAVIGTQINPDYSGFAGANLTIDPDPVCPGLTVINKEPTTASTHDTDVTAFIIGNGQGTGGIRGMAPDAAVTFIGYGDGTCSLPSDPENPTITSFGLALKRAMQDGAQIVSTSTGVELAGDDDGKVLAEAIARGIVVVAAPPNSIAEQRNGEAPSSLRGVVSVSAVDADGRPMTDSTTNQPVVVPNVTVAAAGVDIMANSPQSWDKPQLRSGSSIATPIVAGMLALTAQKYPNVGGNQLIQSLIHNTGRDDHPLQYSPADGLGYGLASLTHLLRVDPSQYPDENPLLNKDPRLNGAQYLPTDAQLTAATSAPASSTPSSATSTPASTGSSPADGILTGVVVGGIVILVLIIAAAVITVILVTRRNRQAPRKDTP